MKLFQEILVWKSVSQNKSVRYVCFLDLETKKYCVQSADFFILPLKKELLIESDIRLIELFTEVSPIDRCDWFDSVVEAISAHELEFNGG